VSTDLFPGPVITGGEYCIPRLLIEAFSLGKSNVNGVVVIKLKNPMKIL
jgi:hypothetical protein